MNINAIVGYMIEIDEKRNVDAIYIVMIRQCRHGTLHFYLSSS